MEESGACLRRSLSEPWSSLRVSEEGDPVGALRESVSFGRFMAEPLDWEKWSAFSRNRYLEEAQRFSKPGSVSQKKAFFEARLKKKAAEQEENACNVSSVETVLDEDAADCVVVSPEIEDSSFKRSELGSFEPEKEGNEPVIRGVSAVEKEDQIQNEIPASTTERENVNVNAESVHMSIQYSSRAGKSSKRTSPIVPKIRSSMNVTASLDMSKSSSASSQGKLKAYAVRALRKPALNHNAEDKRGGETETVNRGGSKPKPPKAPCLFSFKSQERAANTKEFNEKSEDQIQSKIPASRTEKGSTKASPKASSSKITLRAKTSVKELISKGNAKSLHMSIQYSSRAGDISKKTSPIMPKMRSSMNITASLDMSKSSSAFSQGKPKVSVVRALRKPASNHIAEDKRGGETEPANGRGSKPRPSMMPCPPSLKSEERAAKRKEFYEKLEERRNANEAMKKNPLTRCQIASVQPRSLASRRNPAINKTRAANDQPCESSKSLENKQCRNRSITSEHSETESKI